MQAQAGVSLCGRVRAAGLPAARCTQFVPVQQRSVHLAASKGFGSTEDNAEAAPETSPRGKSNPRPARKPQQQQAEKPTASTAVQATKPAPQGQSNALPQQQPQRPSPSASRGTPGSTPQVVVDRMFSRMLVCAGTPVALGIALLVGFYYLKVVNKAEFPMWIVYLSQNLTFGGGLLGITYGILSTSWDPSREGSALGWDEFRANLPIVLNRNKQQ